MLVNYLITRPSAALFLKHIRMLSLYSFLVLVKVSCYACELFDNAAFGRVIFKSYTVIYECYPCIVLLCL